MHFDDMYSLELVCQGLEEIYLAGGWRPVPPMHILWNSPYMVHAHRFFPNLETIFVLFPTPMVEQVWQDLYKDEAARIPDAMILPCSPELQRSLVHLLQEVRNDHPTSPYIVSLLLHLVSAEFLRCAAQPAFPVPVITAPSFDPKEISDVICHAIHLLERHHNCSSLTLESIAQTIGLSFFHFSRRFKREVGVTPGHYLRQQRLNHALPLLFSTTLSMEEIAYQSGFRSSNQLADACKAVLGQAPSHLRKMHGFSFLSPPSLPSHEGDS